MYATDPDNVAADGEGRNGLFTDGLLIDFKTKDLSLDEVLTIDSSYVEKKSAQQQTPYVNGPLTIMKQFKFRKKEGVEIIQMNPARAGKWKFVTLLISLIHGAVRKV